MEDVYVRTAESWRAVGFTQCQVRIAKLLRATGELELAGMVLALRETEAPDAEALVAEAA